AGVAATTMAGSLNAGIVMPPRSRTLVRTPLSCTFTLDCYVFRTPGVVDGGPAQTFQAGERLLRLGQLGRWSD
ncbi:hypothetical protein, partial [Jiangella alkaliphila]|uniref:hypothetical protein n=1 Tax=Jiangella alkaliphila TaxID=419479 RepID=UPI001F1BA8F6